MRKKLLQTFPAAITGVVVLLGLHLMGLPAATPVAPVPTVDLSDIQLAVSNPTLDIFLDFVPAAGSPLVKGESTAKTHPNLVEASSIHFAIANTAAVATATSGAGAGKAAFDKFVLTKGLDLASAPLFLANATGQHYSKVTVFLDKAAGTTNAGQVAMRITLGTVFVNKVDVNATPAYTETVELSFGSAKLEYFAPGPGGLSPANATNVQSWSVIENKQVPTL